jgi:hypothetical protein
MEWVKDIHATMCERNAAVMTIYAKMPDPISTAIEITDSYEIFIETKFG